MSSLLFVTGMLRSGTTLVQTLLDNHPAMAVAYQPFHQFFVDVKKLFLKERGLECDLPLDDGDPALSGRRDDFTAWLATRTFTNAEATTLFGNATTGKGGGMPGLRLDPAPASGNFIALYRQLLETIPAPERTVPCSYLGSKEILCEEFVPALVAAGTRCVLVLRDPRAVIASAGHGRYREMVGDRYPLMMMIRLWRKTAAHWLHFRTSPRVLCLRYEDIARQPQKSMDRAVHWLGLSSPAEGALNDCMLLDPKGSPWSGNSSFGDKSGVDSESIDRWQSVMSAAESRYISACCVHEMREAGYPIPPDLVASDISDYREDTSGVRALYLDRHRLDEHVLRDELARFDLRPQAANADMAIFQRYFMYPEAFSASHRNVGGCADDSRRA